MTHCHPSSSPRRDWREQWDEIEPTTSSSACAMAPASSSSTRSSMNLSVTPGVRQTPSKASPQETRPQNHCWSRTRQTLPESILPTRLPSVRENRVKRHGPQSHSSPPLLESEHWGCSLGTHLRFPDLRLRRSRLQLRLPCRRQHSQRRKCETPDFPIRRSPQENVPRR